MTYAILNTALTARKAFGTHFFLHQVVKKNPSSCKEQIVHQVVKLFPSCCKENIQQVGVLDNGLGVYVYEYKPAYKDTWGHGQHIGVMAQEVEQIIPEAVSVHPDGYKMVNYSMIH